MPRLQLRLRLTSKNKNFDYDYNYVIDYIIDKMLRNLAIFLAWIKITVCCLFQLVFG
jgi:hypothetical protein